MYLEAIGSLRSDLSRKVLSIAYYAAEFLVRFEKPGYTPPRLIFKPEGLIPFVQNGPQIENGFVKIMNDVMDYYVGLKPSSLDSVRDTCDLFLLMFGLEEIPSIVGVVEGAKTAE